MQVTEKAALEFPGAIECVTFSSDNSLIAAAGFPNHIKVWEQKSLTEVATFLTPSLCDGVFNIQFSADTKHLLSVTLDAVQLWDINSKTLVWELNGDWLYAMFTRDDSHILTVSDDKVIAIWNIADKKIIEQENAIQDLTMQSNMTRSSNNKYIFSDNVHKYYLWKTTRNFILTEYSHYETVATISPDKNKIAIVRAEDCPGPSELNLWENPHANSKSPDHSMHIKRYVNSAAFSPDNTTVCLGLDNGQINMFDFKDATNKFEHEVDKTAITTLAWSSDGSAILAGTKTFMLRLLEVS